MLQTSIRRGELDRDITIIQPIIVDDAANAGANNGYEMVATYPTVKAKKKDLAGREVVVGDRLTYIQNTIWTIVHRDDLTTRNRVVYKTRQYEVIAITEPDSNRGQYIELHTNLLDTEVWT